jgi:glycosyltransferase involved in cell wall biosynthesis/ADP-heptose:LPS heptosyltransferase
MFEQTEQIIRRPTVHFVYSGDPYNNEAIRAPKTIANKLFRFLEQRINVRYYDLKDEEVKVNVRQNDIILGHPYSSTNSVIWKLFRQPCAKKYLIWPLHTGIPEMNRYSKPLAEIADRLFIISGPYWTDTLDKTEYAGWKDKIVRVDNAVDSNIFALIKKQFNPAGRRGLFVFGRSGAEKGTGKLFELLAKTTYPVVVAGDYNEEDLQIIRNRPKTTMLGRIDWRHPDTVEYIMQTCDFFVNMSVSDASPTTLLETMAIGVVPITTPQCGYYYPSFIMLSQDDPERNILMIQSAQLKSEQELKELQAENRRIIEQKHNWEQFCRTIWEQIERDIPSLTYRSEGADNLQEFSDGEAAVKSKVDGEYFQEGMTIEQGASFGGEIKELFRKIRPRKIIETGTYLGKGTTTIISNGLKKAGISDAKVFTIEVNPAYYIQARDYFKENNMNIKCLEGVSVPRLLIPSVEEVKLRKATYFENVLDGLIYHCLTMMNFQPDFVLLDSGERMSEIELNYLVKNLRGQCHIAVRRTEYNYTLEQFRKDSRFEIAETGDGKSGFYIIKFAPGLAQINGQRNPLAEYLVSAKSAAKVLIVRPDSIGDFVIFGAILKYFKRIYPTASISILLQEHFVELAESCPFIDEVIPFRRKDLFIDESYTNNLVQILRDRQFDAAINPVYSRDETSDYFTLSSGAKVTIASVGDDSNQSFDTKIKHDGLYTYLVPAKYELMLETERNEEFIRGFGIEPDEPVFPKIWLTDEDRRYADNLLAQMQIKNPIVISPFGQYEIKNWPVHKWSQLMKKLEDYPTIITGTGKNFKQAQQIIETAGRGRIYNLCGKTTIRQLGAILEKSVMCIGVDTAAAHISAAVGCKNVVITGGAHFGRFLPYSPTTTLVYLPLDCFNCNYVCPFQDWEIYCISQIKVDTVEDAIRSSLQEPVENRTKPVLVGQQENRDRILPLKESVESDLEIDIKKAEPEKKYLVTAIVSTYNSGRHIAGCLEDLESQTIADRVEIVVVDSGSKQDEGVIVREFQKRYDNIKYIRTEDRETVYSAWNRAIQQASGKYITNANTDDRHREDAIEIMVKALESRPDIALVYSDQQWVDEEGKVVNEFRAPEYTRHLLLFDKCYVSSNPMWRKSVHSEFGYFEGDLFFVSGDREFWLRISQRYDFLHINLELGIRRFTPDCISRKNVEERDGIDHLEAGLITKCYHYALEKGIIIDNRGISGQPAFSEWFELGLLQEKLKAKLQGRSIQTTDYVTDFRNYSSRQNPKLSIVLDIVGGTEVLRDCLLSLNNQTETDFEVIVVNSGDEAGGIEEIKGQTNFGFNYVQLNRNLGRSFARNTGANLAKADVVAFLNISSRPDKYFVEKVCGYFRRENIIAIRGRIKAEGKSVFEPDYFDLGDCELETCIETDTGFAFRKRYFDSIGGFDIDLTGYRSQELSYRIFMTSGERINNIYYVPNVVVCEYKDDNGDIFLSNLDDRIGRATATRKWLWQKYNLGLESYLEFMRNCYPANCDRRITDYRKCINIAMLLEERSPEAAVNWATKAVQIRPNVSKGHFLLGSLLFRLGRFSEAEQNLIKAVELLEPAMRSGPANHSQREIEKYAGNQQCCLSCCTKLAQCYMRRNDLEGVRRIYTYMLNNRHLEMSDDLRFNIESMLSKLPAGQLSDDSLPSAGQKGGQSNIEPVPVQHKPTKPNDIVVKKGSKQDIVLSESRQVLVSAIVSSYNAEQYIAGCLEDLESQTISDRLEIIVVNSGSKQNEERIVREFQKKYDNIKYIRTEEREGIYTAWNRAVRIAQGEFLTNANTDDRHSKDAFEIMTKTLSANPDVALVYGDQMVTKIPNDDFCHYRGTEYARRPEYSRERLFFGCCVGSQPMWRRRLHDEFGYFDETLTCAGDWDFWLKVAGRYRFKHIPEFLGLYYNNGNGIENGRKIHSLYERYLVGKRYGNPYISVIELYQPAAGELVSVVMSAYNAGRYIAEGIESVLIQNYRNFEIVVVDDGSTDDTKDIVAGFKDDKIRYYYRRNGGAAVARNFGIKEARGSFIVFLDADDMMTPNFISSHLIEFEKDAGAEIVYCDDFLIDQEQRGLRVIKRPEYGERKYLVRDLFRCGFPVVPFRTCIRKEVFGKIGFYEEGLLIAEDFDMVRRAVKSGVRMRHLNSPLYLRRMTADGLSRSFTIEKAKYHFKVLKRFTDTFGYDELFPDVEWDKVEQSRRRLHGRTLTALTYLTIGRAYTNTGCPIFAQTAGQMACYELKMCLAEDPRNERLQQMLKRCELVLGKMVAPQSQPVYQTT